MTNANVNGSRLSQTPFTEPCLNLDLVGLGSCQEIIQAVGVRITNRLI